MLAYAGSGYLFWKLFNLASLDLITVSSGIGYLLIMIGVLAGIIGLYNRIEKWIDKKPLDTTDNKAWTSILWLSSIGALLGIGWGLKELMYLMPLKDGYIFFLGICFAAEMVVIAGVLVGMLFITSKKKNEEKSK
ncbi:MAG: hypothetical protein WCJ45_03800 [bacterium]